MQLQNAADAAAVGAAHEMERGSPQSIWLAAGKADSALNGFTDGQNSLSVTLSNPPSSGSYSGSNQAIQATITQAYSPTFFPGNVTLSAQSVALGGGEPCTYFLSRVATGDSLSLSGSQVNANCGLYMGKSLSVSTSKSTTSGQYLIAGAASASTIPSGEISPSPIFNMSAMPDPLAEVPSPAFSSCTQNGAKFVGNVTISPGTYCGGLSLGVGGSNSNVVMNPGLYIVTGGMIISGSVVSGTGVTIFLTQGGGSSYGALSISQSEFDVSAPASAGASGVPSILVFADRSWNTGEMAVSFAGSSFQGDGLWYLPGTALALQGSEFYASNYLGVVADSATVNQSEVSLKSNYSAGSAGDPYGGNVSLVQ